MRRDRIECTQEAANAAVGKLNLQPGMEVGVPYLPKRPRQAFIDALVVAERAAAVSSLGDTSPVVYFISYTVPPAFKGAANTPGFQLGQSTRTANTFRWYGDGTLTISDRQVVFTAVRPRPFWFPQDVNEVVARDSLRNVEVFENAVRCEIASPGKKAATLQFWALNAADAKAIGAQLPDTKTERFAPAMAEGADFAAKLREVTPSAPVTIGLIAINVALFGVEVWAGNGVWMPRGDTLIRLGSEYTPLTLAGQWWRLGTAMFLHASIAHLAFNMWALWVFGNLAERLYGSTRFLFIYLVAGVAGSLASFLWHPIVNGVGASGAIFGILGALVGFFVNPACGVPQSVVKAQRNSAALYILVSILNSARIHGVDNAAHLGGVFAGLVLGVVLTRPLARARDNQDWTAQWLRAVVLTGAMALSVAHFMSTGQVHPRLAHDDAGRPLPLQALQQAPRTFGGVTLGMTSDEVRASRGEPTAQRPGDWVYPVGDGSHGGEIHVFFTQPRGPEQGKVVVILFSGIRATEVPAGMPNLLDLDRNGVVAQLGEPELSEGDPARYLYFRNGTVAWMSSHNVFGYGVYDKQLLRVR